MRALKDYLQVVGLALFIGLEDTLIVAVAPAVEFALNTGRFDGLVAKRAVIVHAEEACREMASS